MVPKAYTGMSGTSAGWVAANDGMFDGLRQMARGVPDLNLLDR